MDGPFFDFFFFTLHILFVVKFDDLFEEIKNPLFIN